MAPRIVDKAEKRIRIAHAAEILFGNLGFDRVKMADVAVAAGVGKGTLYEYFRDKEELFHGAFETMMDGFNDHLGGAVVPGTTPLESLRSMSRAMVEVMEHMGEGYRFFMEYMVHVSRESNDFIYLKDWLTRYRQGVHALLQAASEGGALRKGLNLETLAAAFLAWFDGAVFHWIVLPGKPGLMEMADAFVDTFIAGIAVEGESR